jgi:ABC-type branched-subunit amino acid transport system substrate-binding protein
MISPASSNPLLTELGRANVFRLENRDDAVGNFCGNYLADHWSDRKIAILHDNTVFGKDSAELTKKQLNHRGVTEAIYQAYVPGQNNYGAEIDELQAAGIDVAFIGGYQLTRPDAPILGSGIDMSFARTSGQIRRRARHCASATTNSPWGGGGDTGRI